jgi:hypothetical protein
VRAELAKEHVDLDAVAKHEHDTALTKREIRRTGRPRKGEETTPLPKGDSTDRRAARLAARRPDLAGAVRTGRLTLAAALIEAGIRKKLTPLEAATRAVAKLSDQEFATQRAGHSWGGCRTSISQSLSASD